VAVRRRPSYGFDLAGSSFGVRPEAGVSRSTLAQLFPELDLGGTAATTSTAAEEVEKPDEETSTATPGAAGITPIEDDTIPGSELDAYKISGSLSYAAPFNLQIGATGPQGRGSRLGYSGAVAKAEPSSTTGLSQSAASVAMPQLPQFDYSPMERLLERGESIMSRVEAASPSMGNQQVDTQQEEEGDTSDTTGPVAQPTGAGATPAWSRRPSNLDTTVRQASSGLVPSTTERGTYVAPTSASASAAAQNVAAEVQQRISSDSGQGARGAAAAAGDPNKLGATGAASLISTGGVSSARAALKQAEKGNIELSNKAQKALEQAIDKAKKDNKRNR
jgi:hypothetical protein